MKNENYEQYRQTQIEDARVYQDFVADQLYAAGFPIVVYSSKLYQIEVGESRSGFEIKFDKRRCETGNLYIETGEKARPRAGEYWPSGIYAQTNTVHYIQGDYDVIYCFPKNILVMLHKSGRYREIGNNGSCTSTGFILPENKARDFAWLVLAPKQGSVIKTELQELQRRAKELYRTLAPQSSSFTLLLPFDGSE